jgi:hypothetical protein
MVDESGETGQVARPSKAATEAGLVRALSVICTVGPGRSLVVRAVRPSRLTRARLLVILMSAGEHCRPDRLPKKLRRAVPVTMREVGCPVKELKLKNFVSPYSPGRARRAEGPVGGTLGLPLRQFWHSWTTRASTWRSRVKNAGACGNGMGNGVWST